MTPGDAFGLLGVPADCDAATLRRRYAELLRDARPEDDSERFQRLRAAYELCRACLRDRDQAIDARTGHVPIGWPNDDTQFSSDEPAHDPSSAPPISSQWFDAEVPALNPACADILAHAYLGDGCEDAVEASIADVTRELSLAEQRQLERALASAIARGGPWDALALRPLLVQFGWRDLLLRRPADPILADPAFLFWVDQADLPRSPPELQRTRDMDRSVEGQRKAARTDLVIAALVVTAVVQPLFAHDSDTLFDIGMLLIAAAAFVLVVGLLSMRRLSNHPRVDVRRFHRIVGLWSIVVVALAGAGVLTTVMALSDTFDRDVRPPVYDLPQFPVGRPTPPSP